MDAHSQELTDVYSALFDAFFFLQAISRAMRCMPFLGFVQGQAATQTPQAVPVSFQTLKQASGLMRHFSTPRTTCLSFSGIAPPGQISAQMAQSRQTEQELMSGLGRARSRGQFVHSTKTPSGTAISLLRG
jgi:hypothetical protein